MGLETVTEEGSRATVPRPVERSWSARHARVVLALLLILAAGLRCYDLSGQSLWLDEAQSMVDVSGSLAEVPGRVARGEATPPLYFLLLRLAVTAGRTEGVARGLSALLGVAAVLALYLLARTLTGAGPASIAALLLAVSPFALHDSREARCYTLFMVLSVASLNVLVLLASKPSRGKWAAYVLLVTAALYTHYYTIFTVAGQGLAVFLPRGPGRALRRGWVLSVALAGLLFLPWVPSMLSQFGAEKSYGGQSWRPSVGVLLLPYTFFDFSLGETAADFHGISDVHQHAGLLLVAALAFGALVVIGWRTVTRHYPEARAWVWAPLVGAVGSAYLANLLVPCYSPTYLGGVMPLYLLVLAAGLWALRPHKLAVVSLSGVVVALLAFSNVNLYANPAFAKEDWRSAAGYLSQEARGGDVIAFHKAYTQTPFTFYYRGAVTHVGLPRAPLPADDPILQEQLDELAHYPRVWLVLAQNYDTGDHYAKVLEGRFRLVKRQVFATSQVITVYLFEPRRSASPQQPTGSRG